ncbi:MAG: carboxypeptidase regulatory-like domain-containing protein [Chitinivibrionales bacterium]|nr:carboxypeptidase regulatory-like domain-containing protein [Chitinivibrionales bacterium]
MNKNLLSIFMIAVFCYTSFAAINQNEMEKAQHYLNKKGEVLFSFAFNNRSDLEIIGRTIVIDRVEGHVAHAYANRDAFDKFVKYGIDFSVIPHDAEIPLEDAFGVDEIDQQMYNGGITKFPSYDAYEQMLKKYEQDYPTICKYLEFGNSASHKLVLVAIGKDIKTSTNKPKIFYTGAVHGDEYTGYGILLNFIDYLLSNYGKDSKVTDLVDKVEFWINPLANPDGCYKSGNSAPSGSTRGNANGTDINRSFPNPAGQPDAQQQVETRAFMKLEQEQHFTLAIDYHGGTQEVVYPWGVWKAQQKRTADDTWFVKISKQYASTAGYFSLVEIGWQMYEAPGERMNYSLYYNHCRDVTIELSTTKAISSSQIQDYWTKNKNALLQHAQEALYGINGTVTDSISGKAIFAKIFVKNHDVDSSWVYSYESSGNFYRPIAAGTYELEITAANYPKKTISNVNVQNEAATVLNIKLHNPSKIEQSLHSIPDVTINQSFKTFTINNGSFNTVNVSIYDVRGKQLIDQSIKPNSYFSLGAVKEGTLSKGHYFISINAKEKTITKQFIIL